MKKASTPKNETVSALLDPALVAVGRTIAKARGLSFDRFVQGLIERELARVEAAKAVHA